MAPGWRLAPARSAASPSPWLSTHRPKPPAQEPARRATRPYLGLEVGGWANPSEKYESDWVSWDDDIPSIWKNKQKWSKPPTIFFANKNLDVMCVMFFFLDCTWMLRCFRSSVFFLVVIGGNRKLKWRFGDFSMGINGINEDGTTR